MRAPDTHAAAIDQRVTAVNAAADKIRAEVAELRISAWNAGLHNRADDDAENRASTRLMDALTELLTIALHADEAGAA